MLTEAETSQFWDVFRESQERGKQVGKPADEAFPRGTAHPYFPCQRRGRELVVLKHTDQLVGHIPVEHERIHLIIVAQTAAVQVGGTQRAEDIVDHHNLGMMESAVVQIDPCPPFG